MIKSPLMKIDEFSMFSQAVNALANQRGDMIQILQGLSKDQNAQLKDLLLTKRVILCKDGGQQPAELGVDGTGPQQEARRVVRVKRRTQQQ